MFKTEEKDIVSIYFKEMGDNPLLNHEKVVKLAKEIENGGFSARQTLICANLRLVVSIARKFLKKYPTLTLPLLDLIQEGNLGLINAAKEFNWRKGVQFSTYATVCIERRIQLALDEQAEIVRVPSYMMRMISRYRAIIKKLSDKLGREPLIEEVASKMNLDVEKVRKLSGAIVNVSSLESFIAKNHKERSRHCIEKKRGPSSVEMNERLSQKEVLKEAMANLTKQEQEIISMRFGLEDGVVHTFREIGEKVGMTGEWARQIQRTVLTKLREDKQIRKLL